MRRKPALPIRIIVYLAILFVAIIINLPFFWMLVTSFKTEDKEFCQSLRADTACQIYMEYAFRSAYGDFATVDLQFSRSLWAGENKIQRS